MSVPLPKGTRAKELNVIIQRRKLKVSKTLMSLTAKVQLKSSAEPIMDGELFNDITVDDSSWTIRMYGYSFADIRG